MRAGSRLSTMLNCGAKRKSSNVHPWTSARSVIGHLAGNLDDEVLDLAVHRLEPVGHPPWGSRRRRRARGRAPRRPGWTVRGSRRPRSPCGSTTVPPVTSTALPAITWKMSVSVACSSASPVFTRSDMHDLVAVRLEDERVPPGGLRGHVARREVHHGGRRARTERGGQRGSSRGKAASGVLRNGLRSKRERSRARIDRRGARRSARGHGRASGSGRASATAARRGQRIEYSLNSEVHGSRATLHRNTARPVRSDRPHRRRRHGRGLPRARLAPRPRRRAEGPARSSRRRSPTCARASSTRREPSPPSPTRASWPSTSWP